MTKLARVRKSVVAGLGTAATVAATIPPDTAMWRWAQLVLAVATVAGVYRVRNAPAPPPPPPTTLRGSSL
jgi:hypothetical protein